MALFNNLVQIYHSASEPPVFRIANTAPLPSGLPLLWVGHSLGGNGLPLVQGLEHINAVITLGSQFGYWAVARR